MKRCITAALIFLVVAAISFGTPIPNGSFTLCTGGSCTFTSPPNNLGIPSGDTRLDNWAISSGGVGWVGSWDGVAGWDTSAASGGDGLTNSIHLNRGASAGAISYDLATLGLVDGQSYSIQFLMSAAPGGKKVLGSGGTYGYGEVFLNVQVSNGLPGPYTYSYQSDNSSSQMHWALNTYNFVYDATVGNHLLTFQSTTTGELFGPGIDGIVVVDQGIPEPGTFSMLLGAGLLLGGFAIKRRRS